MLASSLLTYFKGPAPVYATLPTATAGIVHVSIWVVTFGGVGGRDQRLIQVRMRPSMHSENIAANALAAIATNAFPDVTWHGLDASCNTFGNKGRSAPP